MPGGGFTVDLAPFVARDDLGIAQGLKNGGAGDYALAADLSFADPAAVKAFPRNVELSATLTFRAASPSAEVRNIVPDQTLSLRLRHSLIALPGPGLRAAHRPLWLYDLDSSRSTPRRRSASRWSRNSPAASGSRRRTRARRGREVVDADRLLHRFRRARSRCARRWSMASAGGSDAFDAAGFINAFEVRELPAGADPLDVRYNVVNWVNRATRGWSYGQPIADPRTGEIVKGAVVLGSLRVRQDILIFQALVGAHLTGTGDPSDPITAALARIRQLGAHEVGHAIGFNHNFAASTQEPLFGDGLSRRRG